MAVQRIVKTLLDDACLLDVICSCMIQKEGQLNASFQRASARGGGEAQQALKEKGAVTKTNADPRACTQMLTLLQRLHPFSPSCQG